MILPHVISNKPSFHTHTLEHILEKSFLKNIHSPFKRQALSLKKPNQKKGHANNDVAIKSHLINRKMSN